MVCAGGVQKGEVKKGQNTGGCDTKGGVGAVPRDQRHPWGSWGHGTHIHSTPHTAAEAQRGRPSESADCVKTVRPPWHPFVAAPVATHRCAPTPHTLGTTRGGWGCRGGRSRARRAPSRRTRGFSKNPTPSLVFPAPRARYGAKSWRAQLGPPVRSRGWSWKVCTVRVAATKACRSLGTGNTACRPLGATKTGQGTTIINKQTNISQNQKSCSTPKKEFRSSPRYDPTV